MFCKNCGKELDESVKFCDACGSQVGDTIISSKEIDKEFKFSVKPVFISKLYFLRAIPATLFFSLWTVGFVGGFGIIIVESINKFFKIGIPIYYSFIAAAILTLIMAFIVGPNITRKNTQNTTYNFYGDRIEYCESYLNKEQKIIHYSRILSVNWSSGIFQQKYRLGSINFSTAENTSRGSGLILNDIYDSEKIYGEVKKLIENNKV